MSLNIVTPGITPSGVKTFTIAEDTSAERYSLYQLASEGVVSLIDTLGARPIGVSPDQFMDGSIAIALFGAFTGTHLVVCGENVVADEELVADENGQAMPLPEDPGTYWVFGRALGDQLAGGLVEFLPCEPRQVVVSG